MSTSGTLILTGEGKETIVKQRENMRVDIYGYILINDPNDIISTSTIENLTLSDILQNDSLSFVFKNLAYSRSIDGYLSAMDTSAYANVLNSPEGYLFDANYLPNEAILSEDGAPVGTFQLDLSIKNIATQLNSAAKFDHIAIISQSFNTQDNKLIYLTEYPTLFRYCKI